nr:hypothetical protein CTI12_AA049970 [Tanacetum cinerariifolium]
MESKEIGFCAVVAMLGIISAAAGFAGEVTKVEASDVYISGNSCVYPSSPALALGIVSAAFAIITQVYISVTFGGCRCCRNDPNSTPISKLLSVLSRVATVIAVCLLLTAAGLNNKEGQVDSYAPPAKQTFTAPTAFTFPMGTNDDPEKGPVPFPPQYTTQQYPQQYTPQQYPTQQYAPQPHPPQ